MRGIAGCGYSTCGVFLAPCPAVAIPWVASDHQLYGIRSKEGTAEAVSVIDPIFSAMLILVIISSMRSLNGSVESQYFISNATELAFRHGLYSLVVGGGAGSRSRR